MRNEGGMIRPTTNQGRNGATWLTFPIMPFMQDSFVWGHHKWQFSSS